MNQGAYVKNCTFIKNQGIIGGAIQHELSSLTDNNIILANVLKISASTFKENTAKGGGMIIFNNYN